MTMDIRYLGSVEAGHVGSPFGDLPGLLAHNRRELISWGAALPTDLGKQYFDVDGIFQIENNDQRDKRRSES